MGTVFDLLDDEWRLLSHDEAVTGQLPGVCLLAGGASSLHDVERFVRSATSPEADRVLLALAGRAVEGDQLAARVLLQLLLPGTRRLARQWWALGDPEDRAAAAIAAVYRRILTYPVERRPGRVAANILMDAALDLRRAVPRVVAVPSVDPTARSSLAERQDAPSRDPARELAELLVDAVSDGTIDRDDAQLIARSRIADDPVHEIGARWGVGVRTLWRRRRRAELALRARHQKAQGSPPSDGLSVSV